MKGAVVATNFNSDDSFRMDDGLDFDFDSIGPDGMAVADDRTPIIKVKDGAVQGAKNYVKDPKKIAQFMRTAMPDGYGKAFDLGRESVEEVEGLYNTARETMKPAVTAAKNITKMALPMARGILPKKIADKLEEFSKPEEESSYYGRSEEEEANDRVSSLIGEVFKAQQEMDMQREEREQYQDQLAESVEQIRHKGQIEQLDSIRLAVTSLQNYQDRVTVNYQKRSLELQYRHYWAAVESLKTQKETSKKMVENVMAIAKNTALPDYAKLTNREALLEQTRNKFITDVRDSLFGSGTSYVRQFGQNARKQITSMIGSFSAGFQGVDQMLTPMLGEDMPGMDKEGFLGEEAANMGLDSASARLGNRVRRALRKNKTVARWDSKVGYTANNITSEVDDLLTNPSKDWRMLEGLRTIIASLAPQRTTDTALELPLLKDMAKPRQFNTQDSKTITEIIPGLLARIHREVRMFRTGDENVPLLTYDFEKSRFSNEKEMISGIRKRFGEGSRAAGDLDKIIDSIDRNKSLTDEQRKAMREILVSRTLNKDDMSARSMVKSSTWGGDQEIAKLFRHYYRADADGRMGKGRAGYARANAFQSSVQSAVSQVGDPFALMQDMVNMGQYGTLLKAGVVTDNGRISLDAMTKLIAGGEQLPNGQGDLGEPAVTAPNQKIETVKGKKRTINIDKSRYNFDTTKLEEVIKATNEQVRALAQNKASTVDPTRVESIDETLKRIEEILTATAEIHDNHYSSVSSEKGEKKSYTSLASHMWDKGVGGVKSLGRGLKTTGKSIFSTSKVLGNLGSFTLAPVLNRVSRLGTRIKHGIGGILDADIFVGSEQKARLHASVLRAGGYVDSATGRVITDLSKLKGDVKDLAGNVVLRVDELKDAFVAGDIRRKLTDFLGLGFDALRRIISGAAGLIPPAVRQVFDIARSGRQAIRRVLPPYDVYVTGDKDPTLYASAFRTGTYFSRKSLKVLWHPSHIDGEVVDKDGNIVLSEEQLKRGIEDAKGVAVANPFLRGFRRVMKPIGNILRTVKDVGLGAVSWVTNKMKDGARFIKELITGRIDIGIYSKRTSDILTEIRDFMITTWGKRRVVGDMNGDGIRDNSLEDMARKRKEKKEDVKDGKDGKDAKDNGFLTRMMGTIGGFFEKFRKKDKKDEDDDDDDGFGLDDAADIADIADSVGEANERRKNRKNRKRRRRNRLGRFGKKGVGKTTGKAAGKAAEQAGKKTLGATAKRIAAKSVVSSAIPRVVARLGFGAAGAAMTAGGAAITGTGMLATGVSAIASGVGALLSWPAMAAMGVGYLGYLAYKKYKETKITPLSTVRLAQYGMDVQKEHADFVKKVFALENMLLEHVEYDNDGWASVSRDKLEQKDLAELFELTSAYQAQRFIKWYEGRFVHVYLAHLSKLKQLRVEKPDVRLVEEQLEPDAKEKFMDDMVSVTENYHGFMKGPIGYSDLTYDHAGVIGVANEQRVKLRREQKNATGKSAGTDIRESAETLMKGKSISEKAALIVADRDAYEVKDKDGNVLQNLTQSELEKAIKGGASIRTIVAVPTNVLLNDPTRLDALTCIRYKTYGLRTMVADKVQSLMGLEAIAVKHVMISKEGATFNANADAILLRCGSVFGKSNTSGRQAIEWKNWFSQRFLPVFLPFIAAVNKLTNSSDYINAIKKLTPQQQLKIANMLTGSAGVGNERVAQSVWECTTSPWNDYELGINPDVVANNLESIRVLVSKIELNEPLAESANKPKDDPSQAAMLAARGGNRAERKHASANARSTQGMMATGDYVGGVAPPGQSNYTGPGEDGGGSMQGFGQPLKIGSGNGRKWADLPEATGSGWSAMKDVIIEAAKAVGVDPKLLASYIAVESSFDPNARPPGGNALGLGQHMPGTWSDMMKLYGAKLGIPAGMPRTDPRASALLTAMYLKHNAKLVSKEIGRDITAGEGYLAHFAGPTGAGNLLDVLKKNPNAIGAQVRPAAARSNPNIFYDRNTKRPFTVKEVVENLNKKLEKAHSDFKIPASDFSGGTGATSPNAATEIIAAEQQGQAAGTQAVAQAAAVPSKNAQAGFADPQRAAQESARPTPAVSASAVNIDLSVKANTVPSGPPMPATGEITLFLKREPSTDDGTFGMLQFPDGTSLMTLELPWRDNKTGVSCIPAGTYKCKKRQTSNFGNAYEVYGVPGRSAILIHAGNSARTSDDGKKPNTQGCILLGMGRGKRGSQRVITASQPAMKVFHDKMQGRPFTLVVQSAKGEEMAQQPVDNAAKGNIERIAAATPAAAVPPTAATSVIGGAAPATPQAPIGEAAPSGLRSTLEAFRASGPLKSSNPAAVPGGVSLSPNVKPTAAEMAARDQSVLVEMAKGQQTANGYLQTMAESAIRREKLLEQLVNTKEAPVAKPQGPAKVSAEVNVQPLKTGRAY